MLISALTSEAATDRVQLWLSRTDPTAVMISDLVVNEFASALSIKVRTNQLNVSDRAKVVGLFTRLRQESLVVAPVSRGNLGTAARFADQHGIGLRAGDALHIAIAADNGATISTLDKRLAGAATSLGVVAELV